MCAYVSLSACVCVCVCLSPAEEDRDCVAASAWIAAVKVDSGDTDYSHG